VKVLEIFLHVFQTALEDELVVFLWAFEGLGGAELFELFEEEVLVDPDELT
jgi:hypothetical protein